MVGLKHIACIRESYRTLGHSSVVECFPRMSSSTVRVCVHIHTQRGNKGDGGIGRERVRGRERE